MGRDPVLSECTDRTVFLLREEIQSTLFGLQECKCPFVKGDPDEDVLTSQRFIGHFSS
jgi:hypothetical protein